MAVVLTLYLLNADSGRFLIPDAPVTLYASYRIREYVQFDPLNPSDLETPQLVPGRHPPSRGSQVRD